MYFTKGTRYQRQEKQYIRGKTILCRNLDIIYFAPYQLLFSILATKKLTADLLGNKKLNAATIGFCGQIFCQSATLTELQGFVIYGIN
jgi:hypothetical protein